MLTILRKNLPTLTWLLGSLAVSLLLGHYAVQAQSTRRPVAEVRTLYPSEWGIEHPVGLAYSANFNHFFLLDKGEQVQPTVTVLSPYEDFVAAVQLQSTGVDPLTLTFDDTANRLLLLKQDRSALILWQTDSRGIPDPTTETLIALTQVGLQSAQGMAVDATGKFLFIFDRTAAQLVRISLAAPLDQMQVNKFNLAPTLAGQQSRGIALNPRNRHLYLLQADQQILTELTQSGQLVNQYDLASLQLADPQALVYAASADRTDDPQTVHLLIADSEYAPVQTATAPESALALLPQLFMPWLTSSGLVAASADTEANSFDQAKFGRIVEVELDRAGPEVSAASVNLVTLPLVQTINTAAFTPPSPDPSGLTYIASSQTLLISDGEVDEMPVYFTGKNLFGATLPGALSYTKTTQPQSNEPVDLAHNPNNGHLFVSDDQKKVVFEFNPGADGVLNTSDDSVTSFSTAAFNSMDPEGLDYDANSGHLFISDGANNEVYRVNPGPNNRFDGLPAAGGDDSVTNFDTAVHNINDPEGVDFVPETGNLILVTNGSDTRLYEVTTAGALVETYDIAAANGRRLAAVQAAPGSNNASTLSYYVADRQVDNNADPNENDGKIYEFASVVTPPTPTPPPTATDDLIYVSSTSNGTVGGIKFADEDMLIYNTAANSWSIYFDGSDVMPTSFDIDGFFPLSDGSILLSFVADATLNPLGLVDDADIVRFTPTSLGTVTAGSFQWYFDGSDVALTTSSEDLDALAVLSDGRLVLSAVSTLDVPGLIARDEDLVTFTPTQLGETTAGAWALYFDGSDVGLTASTEDINGIWVDPANGELYLTPTGAFAVTGASGDGADIFGCTPGSLGATTACTYRLYWDGSAQGFGSEIADALYIKRDAAVISATLDSTVHAGEGDDPLADPNEGPDDEAEVEEQLFLPLLGR